MMYFAHKAMICLVGHDFFILRVRQERTIAIEERARLYNYPEECANAPGCRPCALAPKSAFYCLGRVRCFCYLKLHGEPILPPRFIAGPRHQKGRRRRVVKVSVNLRIPRFLLGEH